MREYRPLIASAVVVSLCALAGGFFGRGALVAQDDIPEQYRVFTAALRAIEANYAGAVEPDRLVYSAIGGLMQTLDPHSIFMDPRVYAQTRERQEGRYYGLGISIGSTPNGDLVVANVFEGSPALERGLRRGDVIARIAGEDTRSWTTEQAVGRLKGPRNTFVGISVRRAGYPSLIDLQVRRDEVHIPTVIAAAMLDDQTGYVKLGDQGFGEHTDEELGEALGRLTANGMTRLLLDLRGNPGGALDQAIRVSNRFLPRGDLIVYTRGRIANSDQDYRASERSAYLSLPMITLVNRSSASASEIVAGALQDHDRSLIVGETTFGKALVQSVYRVSQGAGAAITTARYYTPSGRMIQRPWDGSFDEYLTYTARSQNASPERRAEDLKFTDGGRQVYSGGGIEPDYRFEGPIEGFNPSRFGRAIEGRGVFEAFARRFTRRGDTRIPPSPTSPRRELTENYEVSAAMVAEFRQFVAQSGWTIDETAWAADAEFIKAMIQKEIDTDLFGVGRSYRNLARRDPQLQFAMSLFPEAQALLELRRAPRRAGAPAAVQRTVRRTSSR